MKSSQFLSNPFNPLSNTISPYNSSVIKRSISHKRPSIKSKTLVPANSIESSSILDSYIKPSKKRHITLNFDSNNIDEEKSKQLEDLFHQRLEQLAKGKRWKSEIEVIDSIYTEICEYFHKFGNILSVLKDRYEKCIRTAALDELNAKIEKITCENESLVRKINSISSIHEDMMEKYENLKRDQMEYERILSENPGFILNFKNIVEIMIKQTNKIEVLKIEIRSLQEKLKIKNKLKSIEVLQNSYGTDNDR